MIEIPRVMLKEIHRLLREAYPLEGCGFLVGSVAGDMRRVETLVPVVNVASERREIRYEVDPRDFLRADREARLRGLEVVGIYHSHPDHPPRPSAFDRERAWKGLSYLVVAVRGGTEVEAHSWVLEEDGSGFALEPLRVVEGEGPEQPVGSAGRTIPTEGGE